MPILEEFDAIKKLDALKLAFKQSLAGKIADIERMWREFCEADSHSSSSLSEIHLAVHGLSGAGGTYGAMKVSVMARELEQLFNSLQINNEHISTLSNEFKQHAEISLAQLKQAADNWQPSDTPYLKSTERVTTPYGNLIYLAEDDVQVAANLVLMLEQAGYQVRHYAELADFKAACKQETPTAIIMDMVFKDGDVAGAKIITELKAGSGRCPPVVFISVRDDIEARLAAARAGAQRYFRKPVDIHKLTQTLHGLTARVAVEPYRALLIDDDKALLEFYSTVLQENGMEVATVTKSLDGLKILSEFKPDIIVLDVYMPDCSGPELAQVIRQDDAWALVPIMFLSTETDLNLQLDAMNLGGDDFLVKPVEVSHLVSAVLARAKRARWSKRLNKDLEAAVRESEFQLITMDHHEIVSTTDVDGNITSVNDRFCKVSKYSRENLIGQKHTLLKSGYHARAFYQDMWDTISQGKVWRGTICNRTKNGKQFWLESTIVPFLNDKGIPYKYVAAQTDNTAIRQSEERLNRSQTFANIGTWDWDIVTGELYWSDRIWPLFGLNQELTKTSYDSFINCLHSDDRQMVVDAVNNCVEHGAEYNIEHRVIWPDGSVHWLHEKGDVLRNAEGKALNMLGVVQGIDKRKRIELALQDSRGMLSSLYELSPLGIVLTDMSGRYLESNVSFQNICGYNHQELDKRGDSPFTLFDSKEQELAPQNILQESGRYGPVEKMYVQKNGGQTPVRVNGMLVTYHNDQSVICSIIEDITDSKQAEQALIKAREEAESANLAKSQFLSNMSHELRTPMNAILGYSQLMQSDENNLLNKTQQENLDAVIKGGDHLLKLINEVLELSKIEAGRIDLQIETVELNDVLAESLDLIAHLASKKNVAINLSQNGIPALLKDLFRQSSDVVKADRVRLRQVLVNLLNNAIKYNRANGNINVDIKKTTDNNFHISIEDTGIGISKDQQSQLFEAFNRLGAEQTDIEGTGIGLVITKNLIELMGGSIGVGSEVGVGSTFWFELPSASLQLVKSDSANYSQVQVAAISEAEHKILYIEDNRANLLLVTKVLARRKNYQVLCARESVLGLEMAMQQKPDLILLDINLPGMNGIEVLQYLRQQQTTASTPIIAISANAMHGDIEKGLQAGFDYYLTKPIDVNRLLQTVDAVLLEADEAQHKKITKN